MFVENPLEDGRARAARMARQDAAVNAEIRRRDTETAITEPERVAIRQTENQIRRMPLDYAAILKHRATHPDLFVGLPSDDECRKALKKSGGKE